jgi:hypothetical protein
MPRQKPTISYNTHGIENALLWDMQVDIPRMEVGRLCKALQSHSAKALGATFYYPDPVARTTTCRYEWFLGKGRKRFLYRVGLMFTVTDEPLRKLQAYVGYGNAHPQYGTTPPLAEDATAQLDRILKLLNSLEKSCLTPHLQHAVSYIQVPHGFYVEHAIRNEPLGALILPTVLVGKENVGVSAFIFTTDVNADDEQDDPADKNLEACGLLTLATGALFRTHFLQWQKRQKPSQFVAAVDPVPENAVLFPPRRWRPWGGRADTDFAVRLEIIVRMFYGLDETLRAIVQNAMFAYRAGLEMLHREPTLASVAFVAALGTLSKRKQCPSNVECRTCGPLSNFRHDLIGEKASLFAALTDLFALKEGDPHFQELHELLTRVYREQRSAYVHGAKLRHRELTKRGFKNAQPTATAPFSEEHLRQLDLRSIEHLTRRAVIKFMARESKIELDDRVFLFNPFKIMALMPVNSQISLPANVWVQLTQGQS